ncbi:hypothetical protein HU001_13365 [Staphylococcus sp. SS21]|nr:hypothetical protein [Staphylococcus singaporensis]
MSEILTKSTITSLSGAVKFLGKSINDLNLKDYIAAQHLLEIINELEKYLVKISIKAEKNCEIISYNMNCKDEKEKKELLNIEEELYLYKMYKDRLKSDAFRNLVPLDIFEDKIEKDLNLGLLVDRDSNITRKQYEMKTEEHKTSYDSKFSQLAQFYKYEENNKRLILNKIYTSISIIASTGLVERILLKYLPFKKIFLRNKMK